MTMKGHASTRQHNVKMLNKIVSKNDTFWQKSAQFIASKITITYEDQTSKFGSMSITSLIFQFMKLCFLISKKS
jgi:hypothetical protein